MGGSGWPGEGCTGVSGCGGMGGWVVGTGSGAGGAVSARAVKAGMVTSLALWRCFQRNNGVAGDA